MFFRISCALLFFFALCVPSRADIHYVNAGDTRARNIASYGGSADSPWVTPSYAMAQASFASFDTMMIYGYRVPTDSSTCYLDYVSAGAKSFAVEGVSSPYGDSPTFFNQKLSSIAFFTQCSYASIKNIRFLGSPDENNIWFFAVAGTSNFYIDGCIFDTASNPEASITASRNAAVAITMGANTVNAYIKNSTFYSRRAPAINITNNQSGSFSIKNCTFFNDSYALKIIGNGDAAKQINIVDCIINTDTFLAFNNTLSNGAFAAISISYSDTFGMKALLENQSGAFAGSISCNYATMTNSDPQFYARNSFCYMSNIALDTASSTGGRIGVLWGYIPLPDPVLSLILPRRPTMLETFQRLLIRRP